VTAPPPWEGDDADPAEPMTGVDTTASDVLAEPDQMLNTKGISLLFAELKDPARRKIKRWAHSHDFPRHFFSTLAAAVAASGIGPKCSVDRCCRS
jgi:hypothetical protein